MEPHFRVRSVWALGLCSLFALTSYPVHKVAAQEGLPRKVQADILNNEIVSDVRRHDLPAALQAIDKYQKLNIKMPPVLLFVEAESAHKVGDPVRALDSLNAFLDVANRKSRDYRRAVELWPQYNTEAAPIKEREDKVAASSNVACTGARRRLNLINTAMFGSIGDIDQGDSSQGNYLPPASVSLKLGNHVAGGISRYNLAWTVWYKAWIVSKSPTLVPSPPLRVEVWAQSSAFTGTLGGEKLVTITPAFTGPDAASATRVGGTIVSAGPWPGGGNQYYTSGSINVVSTGTLTNPPVGKYCIVIVLEEEGECPRSGNYCVRDWSTPTKPVLFK